MSYGDNLVTFMRLASGLYAPGYRYTGGRDGSSYRYCQNNGVDCSGMFDVCFRTMNLKGSTPWGTVAISNLLQDWKVYEPDAIYKPGVICVNDNAVAWDSFATDNSHVGMIFGGPSPVGQLMIHSRPGSVSSGVVLHESDVQVNQWAAWEWVGFLPGLNPGTGVYL